MKPIRLALVFFLAAGGVATFVPATGQAVSAAQAQSEKEKDESISRSAVLKRAKVWIPTPIPAKNLKAGPADPGGFSFQETVSCTWEDKQLGGKSPKFACLLGKDDSLKVKYGVANGEVYGEVLATRLLWALGFGADRMYPVQVICRGCPEALGGERLKAGETLFDPAVIERKLPGAEFEEDAGWSWRELDDVDEKKGGSPKAQRDAFKLLAVFIQHTDTKPQQQRLLCLDEPELKVPLKCMNPLLMLNDVGLTFGTASNFNTNKISGVNFKAWDSTPVWKHSWGCTGNLPMSMTGTLNDPVIGEKGRQFLAGLLTQLSDKQIHDLFEISRVTKRELPGHESSVTTDIEDWVRAFKKKREEIVTRHCDEN